ncbi:MAG: YdcF family protein [Gammaproteobacteria bacterium]|nr:YdcF family protein [Gammaproteobacteria bacterium]
MLAGWLAALRWRRLGNAVLLAAIALLYVASLPGTARLLMDRLQNSPALSAPELAHPGARAIVVLGGGRYYAAPEYGGDTVSRYTLERLRYAAWLQRRTGLPLLVSGGSPRHEQVPEAVLMKNVLVDELHVPVRWLETASRTTAENALYTKALLARAHVERVYLVTDAWHMRRAVYAFHRAGVRVIPAPTGFFTSGPMGHGLYGLLPRARALAATRLALHEWLGLLWYRIILTNRGS